MIWNYFKIAVRNLTKNKMLSTINVFGLSVSCAIVLLLGLYILFELGADQFHKNYDQIYRLQTQNSATLSAPYAEILGDNFPEIRRVTRIRTGFSRVIVKKDQPLYLKRVLVADDNFFDVFSYESIAGNLTEALKPPASVVLTRSEARRIFGEENPVGQFLEFQQHFLLKVTAVIADPPQNASLHFSAIVPTAILRHAEGPGWNDLSASNFQHFILTHGAIDPVKMAQKVKLFFNQKYPGWNLDSQYEIFPFKKIYFSKMDDSLNHGNLTQLLLLAGIGLLILVVSLVNFINLAIARASRRMLEIGVRKVVGASRRALVGQFLSESVLLCLLAAAIALVWAELLIPGFNSLFRTEIALSVFQIPKLVFFVLAGGVLLGFIAGLYPGIYLAAFNPVKILKGGRISGKAGLLNKGLLVFQFSASILLVICALVIGRQRAFLQNRELGFDQEKVLLLFNFNKHNQQFLEKLKSNPNIAQVAVSDGTPGFGYCRTTTSWRYKGTEREIDFLHYNVDANYLPLMGFELKSGRLFSAKDTAPVCVVNETAIREFGIDDPSQAFFSLFSEDENPPAARVVGVVRDFNQESLHASVQPFIFFYQPNPESGLISLKLKSTRATAIRQTLDFLEDLSHEFFPDVPFNYQFLDDHLANQYLREVHFEKIFSLFAALAVLIACLGLLGLAAFMIERRTREIGIRKVLGASVAEILTLLSREYIKWILLANLFAWPIAWYAMHRWLQNFAYRIEIGWWIFALAGGLALGVALLTVSWQAVRAATINPVESLRYE